MVQDHNILMVQDAYNINGPGPLGPYGPGPLIILKNILSSNSPGPYLKSTLLQEHIANMLLEQFAFQIRSWSIWLRKFFQIINGPGPYYINGPGPYNINGPGPYKSRPKSPKSYYWWKVIRERVNTADTLAHSVQTFKIQRTPLYVRVHEFLSINNSSYIVQKISQAIIVYNF